MAYCPNCGKGYVYFPFYGSPECVNSACEFFSSKHYLAMKDEIEKQPTIPPTSELNFDDPVSSFGDSTSLWKDQEGDVQQQLSFSGWSTTKIDPDFDGA